MGLLPDCPVISVVSNPINIELKAKFVSEFKKNIGVCRYNECFDICVISQEFSAECIEVSERKYPIGEMLKEQFPKGKKLSKTFEI
jgi:hypothetical protein